MLFHNDNSNHLSLCSDFSIFFHFPFVSRKHSDYLSNTTFCAFVNHPRIWNIRSQLEIYTPTFGAPAGCLNNSRHDSKYRHVLNILTLKLPAQSIPGGKSCKHKNQGINTGKWHACTQITDTAHYDSAERNPSRGEKCCCVTVTEIKAALLKYGREGRMVSSCKYGNGAGRRGRSSSSLSHLKACTVPEHSCLLTVWEGETLGAVMWPNLFCLVLSHSVTSFIHELIQRECMELSLTAELCVWQSCPILYRLFF